MRSPLPRPPTFPSCSRDGPSTYTVDSDLAEPSHACPTVLASRSFPSHSDIAYWLTSQPGTEPPATYRGRPAPEMSNLYTSVRCGRGGIVPPRCHAVGHTCHLLSVAT